MTEAQAFGTARVAVLAGGVVQAHIDCGCGRKLFLDTVNVVDGMTWACECETEWTMRREALGRIRVVGDSPLDLGAPGTVEEVAGW